jgi:hypothetical protein
MELPENTVYVARPSKWGNPFRVGMYREYTHANAVSDYERWLKRDLSIRSAENTYGKPPTRKEIRSALRGKHLACWCDPKYRCHADVLLRIANS